MNEIKLTIYWLHLLYLIYSHTHTHTNLRKDIWHLESTLLLIYYRFNCTYQQAQWVVVWRPGLRPPSSQPCTGRLRHPAGPRRRHAARVRRGGDVMMEWLVVRYGAKPRWGPDFPEPDSWTSLCRPMLAPAAAAPPAPEGALREDTGK